MTVIWLLNTTKMQHLKKNWFYILVILSLFSCDIQKKAIKNKEDRNLKEFKEQITKRRGDTVTYTVPKITYKDTIIYTVNRQGTTLRTVYNEKGNIEQIECFASMIEEITRSNRELVEAIKQKDKEKTEDFDSSFIIYIVLGIVLIFGIGFFFVFKYLTTQTSALTQILNKIK